MRLLQSKIKSFINVFIEIDNGYHRTGVRPDQDSLIHGILAVIKESNFVTFAGFLSHAGHAYKARSTSEILNVHDTTKRLMVELGNRYRHEFPNLKLSIGDTPTCSVANDFDGVDEIRPGNFIFYDLTQKEIGSCELSDVSVCMACPIVAVYPERGEMIIHGGAVHFSKDSLTTMGKTVLFGQAVQLTTNGWNRPLENVYLKSLSQEHGILHCPDEMIAHFKVGDIIGVIPVHSCLTADSMGCYQRLTGEKIDMMKKGS
ncbi:MAG: alanine racemase [Flammeovirgaceae bacterium]|nr:alanine racemase [Flammeovirgaceae bacterium]